MRKLNYSPCKTDWPFNHKYVMWLAIVMFIAVIISQSYFMGKRVQRDFDEKVIDDVFDIAWNAKTAAELANKRADDQKIRMRRHIEKPEFWHLLANDGKFVNDNPNPTTDVGNK